MLLIYQLFCRVMNQHENCTYCSGFNLIHHSEGVTCSDCCRLQPLPLYLGSETGCWEGRDLQLSEKYPELRNLVDRHLINEEVGRESRIMVDHLRKHNVNLSSVMLLKPQRILICQIQNCQSSFATFLKTAYQICTQPLAIIMQHNYHSIKL